MKSDIAKAAAGRAHNLGEKLLASPLYVNATYLGSQIWQISQDLASQQRRPPQPCRGQSSLVDLGCAAIQGEWQRFSFGTAK